MKNLVKLIDLESYTLAEGQTMEAASQTIESEIWVDTSFFATWMKKSAIKAPESKEIPSSNGPEPKHKEVVLHPDVSWKRIPKYSRYEINKDAAIRNAQTLTEVKKEQKGEVTKARLTSDTGSRDWVDCGKIFNDLFQATVETGKPAKKAAAINTDVSLSRSQVIWFLHKDGGLDAKQIVAANPEYNEGHVRNVIKDYSKNAEKQKKAENVKQIVAKRDAVKA